MNCQNYCRILPLLVLYCTLSTSSWCQEGELEASSNNASVLDKALLFPDKLFGAIDKKTTQLSEGLDKHTQRYLSKIQRQEAKLKKKLWRKDSLLAKEIFADSKSRYDKVKEKGAALGRSSQVYSGRLDSLTTSLNFFKSSKLTSSSLASLPNNASIEKTLQSLKGLQGNLDAAKALQQQLQERKALLQEHFQHLGMVKELKQFKKQVYYYQAQVAEYKALLNDPSKWEAKLLDLAQKLPQFKSFFAKHSQLGQLFALPGADGSNPDNGAMLVGLQTRASVQQGIQQRFGADAATTQMLQERVSGAQAQLTDLRSRAHQYATGNLGNSGSTDMDMPEGFKPNDQKTKSLLRRLEWGGNIQSERARTYFPVTSDLGLSLGYKLNDKSVVGIGASYKLGLGKGWNNIAVSHQGVGLRSYVDVKLKGSIYISGGYEQNYRTAFRSIDLLKDFDAWQHSGLLGLSKKYKAGKLKGNMQLLWDFLSYQQVPQTQAIIWRIGYNFK